ncbi:MAG: GDP-mannose dehydrogenase [Verrucomicrobiales bacterium]|nr:GDP-mannose dehydrogenase [Verrucomicrobiales bacterium]
MNVNISIFGLGYVGCVGLGCLAQTGHRVIGVDPQKSKVDFINAGRATIIETGIDQILAKQHEAGNISATTDCAEAISRTEVSFICVGTPSTPNGHLDLGAILHVVEEIGTALKNKPGRHVIALRSTVLPGTNEKVVKLLESCSGKIHGQDFAVVSNPEFLREATAVEDFHKPPFTLIGSRIEWATDVLKRVYASVQAPFLVVEPEVAELMKYVCNSYHALKITFANEVGNICERLNIDSRKVMEIFCLDTKLNISKAYLKPGFAYGGSCLPKDLKALRTIAHDHYLECPVLEGIERSNELQKELVCREIQRLGKRKVGFLGLSFKAGTDDLRESPIVDVIERLLGKGFSVLVYDEHVHISSLTGANREFILQKIPYISSFISDDLKKVVENSELIVIVNNEPRLKAVLAALGPGQVVYDLANAASSQTVGKAQYLGVSW